MLCAHLKKAISFLFSQGLNMGSNSSGLKLGTKMSRSNLHCRQGQQSHFTATVGKTTKLKMHAGEKRDARAAVCG